VFCFRKKAQKSFLPKLNWNTLANCVDKYLNSQTETMESELPTCEFGYGKYLIIPFWYASAASGSFGLAMGILARLRLAKIRTMARPNSTDMPLKRTKKVWLVIILQVGRVGYNHLISNKRKWNNRFIKNPLKSWNARLKWNKNAPKYSRVFLPYL